jgi:hypothetical protein
VWRAGPAGRLLGAALLPELFFAMFLNAVYVKGIIDISLARRATWEHTDVAGASSAARELEDAA